MAKKKMSKKTKYTLLGIGLVAAGAGYLIAKHIKNSVAGIGAVRYSFPMMYRGYRIDYTPIVKGKPYLVYRVFEGREDLMKLCRSVKEAKQYIDYWQDNHYMKSSFKEYRESLS